MCSGGAISTRPPVRATVRMRTQTSSYRNFRPACKPIILPLFRRRFQVRRVAPGILGCGNKSGQGLKKPPFHGSSEAHRDKPGGSPVVLMWDARKNCHAGILFALGRSAGSPAQSEMVLVEFFPACGYTYFLSPRIWAGVAIWGDRRKKIFPRWSRGMDHKWFHAKELYLLLIQVIIVESGCAKIKNT